MTGGELVVSTTLSAKEALMFTCSKCSYVWVEKPLDVKEREKAQNV